MKLSVSNWSVQKLVFNGQMDIRDFINLCNENGVKYVELVDCFCKRIVILMTQEHI
jgi:hypothetical protein